jgi:hypothetical protein
LLLFAKVVQIVISLFEGLTMEAKRVGQFGVVEVGVAAVVLVLGLYLVGIVTPSQSVR